MPETSQPDLAWLCQPPHHLHCHTCGKQVSTAFLPLPTDTPDKGLIVRAYIQCPECLERGLEAAATRAAGGGGQ